MVDLPCEIWLYITDFLRDDWKLYPRLLSVNPVFPDVALNRMWSEVNMDTGGGLNMQRTMHALKRLSDPFISKRLKILTIECRHYEPKPTVSTSQETNTSQEISEAYEDFPTPYGRVSSREVLDCIIRALPQFHNIEEISLEWYMPPSYNHEQKEILQSIWSRSPFLPNLKSLWLAGASLKDHRVFIETMPTLSRIEDVVFIFDDRYVQSDKSEVQDLSIFTSHILPYIEGVSPNLRSLSVRVHCFTGADCSPFFENLPRLPALRELCISAYYDTSLKDLSSLYSFLERCPETVRTLELDVVGLYEVYKPEDLAKQIRLDEWLLRLFTSRNPRLFTNLEELAVADLSPTQRRADIVIAILEKTRKTLRILDLALYRYYKLFNSEELARIFDAGAKCRRLNILRIYIDCFDWKFLDMFTRKLPSLQTLSISYAKTLPIISGELGQDETIPPPVDGPLKGWVYREQWKLDGVRKWQTGGSLHIDNLKLAIA
ncbi:hypothetical protein CPC08DRAFT_91639 [Agrocybe pediades]|nr:hypothetical protein CPC08DRAFT_91639 [Agrocybe pediades]